MESLLSQTSEIPDIILVDNASKNEPLDDLEKYAADHKSKVHFIKNPVNSGYTGGNNVGFQFALEHNYEYIGTLNPDAVADSKWTSALLQEFSAHDDIGIATGILARTDHKTIDSTGDFYTTWGIPGPRGRDGLLVDAPKKPEYVFGSTGGGFIARADTLKQVGLLDERFFMYFEDVDLCFRAQLQGFKVRYTPKAVAYHKLSASTKKVPGLAVKQTFVNLPMLFMKNVPLSLWSQIYPRFTLAYSLILINAILRGRGMYALKGWFKSWQLLPHMLRERRRIQANRTVSNTYINSIILHDIPPEQTGLRKFRKIFTGK